MKSMGEVHLVAGNLHSRAQPHFPNEVKMFSTTLPAIRARAVLGQSTTRAALLALGTAAVVGCNDPITKPNLLTPQSATSASAERRVTVASVASVLWNQTARNLVASHNTNGPLASRVYALVSVAQFSAATSVMGEESNESAGNDQAASKLRPSQRAAVIGASWTVLRSLFPDSASTNLLDAQLHGDEAAGAPAEHHTDFAAGEAVGKTVGQEALARAATDGAAAANCPATPPGPPSAGFWFDDALPPNPQPVLPCFGKVRPFLFTDVTQFRAGPPPAFGSPEFNAAVAVVRHISDTRTPEQLAIVDKWLDGNNSPQPPGRWNTIAAGLIERDGLNERRAARTFALMNMAMMDTHIACWDRKYTSWRLRPWQADPLITTPRGRPHHPSNPSGHACAGGAGSGVLAGLFPNDKREIMAMADEEGFSTVLSGVHFPYDVVDGLRIGRAIAALALETR
jgi:membrane-associated phospholipid phosphatase